MKTFFSLIIVFCLSFIAKASLLKDCHISTSKEYKVEFTDETKKTIKCTGITPVKKGTKYFILL